MLYFAKEYHEFFNFILDCGTMEHIFDIKSVMSNIVHVTKKGGYVLQITPAQNYLNHGFYQFSPTLFHDFYTLNGFEVLETYIIEIRGKKHRFHEYQHEKDYTGELFFNPDKRLMNCFLVRKIESVEEVKTPCQYLYRKLIENPTKVENAFNKTILDKIVTRSRKIIPVRWHSSFYGIWTFLKRISTQGNYFDIRS